MEWNGILIIFQILIFPTTTTYFQKKILLLIRVFFLQAILQLGKVTLRASSTVV